jgi:hypothetical protein
MATLAIRRPAVTLGPLQIAICTLVAATAVVHLSLGAITTVIVATQPALVASKGGAGALVVMAGLFYCNFAGYVVLCTALYLPALRRLQAVTRWALIAFAGLTILAYFGLAAGNYGMFDLADKACELALIALLLVERRRSQR